LLESEPRISAATRGPQEISARGGFGSRLAAPRALGSAANLDSADVPRVHPLDVVDDDRRAPAPADVSILLGSREVVAGDVDRVVLGVIRGTCACSTRENVPSRACTKGHRKRLPTLRARRTLALAHGRQVPGHEAPVVFYSTTNSSGDEVPRGLEFLFSRTRLNVAISRTQSLALLVGSPRLLDVRTRSVDQMRLVNALRFVELAEPEDARADG
jgi:hypothetical protein